MKIELKSKAKSGGRPSSKEEIVPPLSGTYLHAYTSNRRSISKGEVIRMVEIFTASLLGMHLKVYGIWLSMFRKRRNDKEQK
jgi:hypothetical protein